MTIVEKPLYSLIPLEQFKAVCGLDDREDALARFCLITATYSIEQYCKRRLLRKKHTENIEVNGEMYLALREYPVSKLVTVYKMCNEQGTMKNEKRGMKKEEWEIIAPELHRVNPECGTDIDVPFYVQFSLTIKRFRNLQAIKVIYYAGYTIGKVPADLAAACLELAVWNMNRYRGRRIGLTGNIRGAGKEGEHFEMSMPENVRSLLEPYKRKTI
jgi:hypothetical protein